jgi:hypothetical protein
MQEDRPANAHCLPNTKYTVILISQAVSHIHPVDVFCVAQQLQPVHIFVIFYFLVQ